MYQIIKAGSLKNIHHVFNHENNDYNTLMNKLKEHNKIVVFNWHNIDEESKNKLLTNPLIKVDLFKYTEVISRGSMQLTELIGSPNHINALITPVHL